MYTQERLAALAGTTPERVDLMAKLGILTASDEGYRPPDIQRVRIAEAFDRAGMELAQIGQMIEAGDYSTGWADLLFPHPVPMSELTFAQACDELDLPHGFAERLFTVSYQLPAPEHDELLREDELELLRIAAQFFPLIGRDEEAGIASARYFGDNVRRLSESQMRFFRTRFEEPMIASGMSQRDAMDLISAMGAPIIPLGFRVVELLHRRHLEHFEIEDIVTNTEIAMDQAGLKPPEVAHPPAIAFCDLTGSTQLTEALGDEAAAHLADRLADVVTTASAKHDGQIVKLLGDGAMLRFHGPAGAARAGLQLVQDAPAADLPPLRMGIHVGPVVFRDGDYYGRTVIVAARVTDLIDPASVVLTADAIDEISSEDLAFDELGPATLKGVSEPVPLYRARPA